MNKKIDYNQSNAQMIALMGIILAISVFLISSLAAEIANVEFVVSTEHISSLPTDFNSIKETFGNSLNYNLIDIELSSKYEDESILRGNINNITKAFNQTKNDYYNISLNYGYFFDASLNRYFYSHTKNIVGIQTQFYKVDITLFLDDGKSYMTEDIEYVIACAKKINV